MLPPSSSINDPLESLYRGGIERRRDGKQHLVIVMIRGESLSTKFLHKVYINTLQEIPYDIGQSLSERRVKLVGSGGIEIWFECADLDIGVAGLSFGFVSPENR